MRQRLLFVVLVILLAFVSCKRDVEVRDILTTIDSFTTELVGRIERAGNPVAGLDDAQRYFDSRRQEIKTRMDELKALRESQISNATKEKLSSTLVDDAAKVGNLQIKYVNQSMNDPAFKMKLDKLIKDYQSLLAE